MANKAKSAKENKQETHETPQAGAADWAKGVVEHLVDAQKKWIDLTAQQNALVLKAVEEGMSFYRTAPTPALGDWARQGVEGLVEAQRRWAEIASQQSTQLFEAIKEGTSGIQIGQVGPSEMMNAVSDYAGQGLESFVKARAQWLDFAAQQNTQVIKAVRDGLNLDDNSPGAALADFAQQAVTNYVEVQKRWLDLATQLPFFGATKK